MIRVSRRRFTITCITVVLCSCICQAQDITSDFEKALGALPQADQQRGYIRYNGMESAAAGFVAQYSGASAVTFLQAKLEDPNSRRFTLLCLAQLVHSTPTAEDALYGAIYDMPGLKRDALTAVAYLERDHGRRVAERLLTRSGPVSIRRPAVDLLLGFGDRSTLELLDQMYASEKDPVVKKGMKAVIPHLRYRLSNLVPQTEQMWATYETLICRALRDQPGPAPRDIHAGKYIAARTLHAQGASFSRDYLEYKLSTGNLVAIAIVANQKESWAIQSLAEHTGRDGALGDFCRSALARIGTDESLRALEASLVPDGNRRANRHIRLLLETHGDRLSGEFLRALADDEQFSDRDRAGMRAAARYIENRLAGRAGPGRRPQGQ